MAASAVFQPLRAFLVRRSDPRLWISPGRALHVVLGNEACDADSIVSSITWAYFRQFSRDPTEAAHWFAPVIACPRRQFRMRAETVSLLASNGVDASLLVFEDEVDWAGLEGGARADAPPTRVTLVDHNRLGRRLREAAPWLADAVEEIVDHHRDEGAHAAVTGDARRISFDVTEGRGVGSTTTLIADSFLRDAPDLLRPQGGEGEAVVPTTYVADLLLSVLGLDTTGLSPTSPKTTALDVAIGRRLESFCSPGSSVRVLTERMNTGKFDKACWDAMAVEDALAYDAKRFDVPLAGTDALAAIGFSSVLQPLHRFLRLDEDEDATHSVLSTLGSTIASQGLDAVVVLTFQLTPAERRELLLVIANAPSTTPSSSAEAPESSSSAPSTSSSSSSSSFSSSSSTATAATAATAATRVWAAVESLQSTLELRPTEFEPSERLVASARAAGLSIRAFEQGNLRASRKQVVPLMTDALARL